MAERGRYECAGCGRNAWVRIDAKTLCCGLCGTSMPDPEYVALPPAPQRDV
jgi:ribosomal protein L37AE/L43A